jgi:hypothetical protein
VRSAESNDLWQVFQSIAAGVPKTCEPADVSKLRAAGKNGCGDLHRQDLRAPDVDIVLATSLTRESSRCRLNLLSGSCRVKYPLSHVPIQHNR